MATATLPPGSLQRMVRPVVYHTPSQSISLRNQNQTRLRSLREFPPSIRRREKKYRSEKCLGTRETHRAGAALQHQKSRVALSQPAPREATRRERKDAENRNRSHLD